MAGGGGDDSATNFDLTALMDVLSNIIFFLMASFGAAVVAVLPTSVPTISEEGESDVARDSDKVTLSMTVAADGTVGCTIQNNDMLPEELKPYAKTIPPKEPGKIDAKTIGEHLWLIKDKFRNSKDAVIVPNDDVTYELLIDVMDASRERHMVVNGKSVYPEMFPAVIVSSNAK